MTPETPAGPAGPAALPRQRLDGGISVLRAALPLPGLGRLAVNAFVLHGREPILVDTGLAALRDPFFAALEQDIDPAALAWIWISHIDADHVGNLAAVLDRAPRARVVTSFLGQGKMMLSGLPADRVRVVAPGEAVDLGDRRLHTLRPPYYDAPETIGFHDEASSTLFVADAYGAALPEVEDEAESIDAATLDAGVAAWSSLDAPWLAKLDRAALEASLASLSARQPRHVLSAHLPPARDLDALNAIVMRLRDRASTLEAAA